MQDAFHRPGPRLYPASVSIALAQRQAGLQAPLAATLTPADAAVQALP